MIIALDARPLITRRIAGAEQRARNILAEWTSSSSLASQQVFHLLYTRPADPELFDDSLLKTLPVNFHPVEIPSYQLPSSLHLASRLFNTLARSIRFIRAAVYLSFTPEVPRIVTCPVVPTIHDLSFELDPNVRRTPAGRALHRITVDSIRYGRRIIAVSSQTKNDIASIYRLAPDRIDVIYNGFDPAFSPLPTTELPTRRPVHIDNQLTRPYVLSVGGDIPRRNYARLLTAMRTVWATSDGAAVKWVLAGRDDWHVSDLYASARAAGVLDRMRFVRSPDNTQLADLYRAASITICASSFEGFGLSVLESMACGTAVACSDMRSLREVAADAAFYFPHDDPESMGQAVAGLLEDAEYRRQLKYRGLLRARLFTWATAAELTLHTLLSTTATPPPSPSSTR